MISLVFAVPYPEMRTTVWEAFEEHPKRRLLSRSIKVVQAEKLDISTLKGSIIVARGMTYQSIRSQFPKLPCVEVAVHTADVIDALLRCRRAHNPRRIAIIGRFPHLPPAETLRALVDCDVACYQQDSIRTMHGQIARALDEGATAFVGGYSLSLWAEANSHPAVVVASNREAIREALDEAIRVYSILRENEISKIALENAREAVLYADADGIVSYLNPAAHRLLAALEPHGAAENAPLGQALPFLMPLLEATDDKSPSFDDELFDWRGTKLTVSSVPAFVGDAPAGSVVTIATVESIRRQEYSIRERLSEKGLRARYTFRNILCGDKRMEQVLTKAKKCARVDSNLLITGETGTGKELFAQSIHNHSGRKNGPFLAVNCAALPEHLIESELFGYSEGAFTGARRGGKLGLIENAHGGTLFLDEVSELPLAVQGKLLRVLQEREVRRIGDDKVATVDVRVISASNISLPDIVRQGRFRRDLLYRLDILNLFIPPLRERREDILILFWHHVRQYNKKLGGIIAALSPEAERLLLEHPFEGNVRELRNVAERLCVLCEQERVGGEEMRDSLNHGTPEEQAAAALAPFSPQALSSSTASGASAMATMTAVLATSSTAATAATAATAGEGSLREAESVLILDALRRAGGNRALAARMLGIDRSTLWRKMRGRQSPPEGDPV